jgi:lipoyl(octanoyl) transferase
MSEIEFISFLKSPSPYPVIWDFQKQRVAEVVAGSSREAVIFCEHEKLVTAGRRTKFENILDRSFPIYEIERGGDVTLHGPGQLVVYPILKLNGGRFPGGLHAYLRFMEQIVIDLLSEMNLVAGRFGPTGVWIKNR